jgi:hypothetical protein
MLLIEVIVSGRMSLLNAITRRTKAVRVPFLHPHKFNEKAALSRVTRVLLGVSWPGLLYSLCQLLDHNAVPPYFLKILWTPGRRPITSNLVSFPRL